MGFNNGHFVRGGAFVLCLVFLLLAIIKAPEWIVERTIAGRPISNQAITPREFADLVDSSRKTTVQVLGGIGGLLALYFLWRRTRATEDALRLTQESLRVSQETLSTSREGQITERFSKAVEQLGALTANGQKAVEVRFGGIYALERIARDSRPDHGPVMEILTAYVRENAKRSTGDREIDDDASRVSEDVQAVLTVLARRRTEHDEPQSALDLANTDLRGADLRRANLRRFILTGSHLGRVQMNGAVLAAANLDGACLRRTVMADCDLSGASLRHAALDQTVLEGANLTDADLRHATLEGVLFDGARLAAVRLDSARLRRVYLVKACDLTRQQVRVAFVDHLTQLPPEMHDVPRLGVAEMVDG